MKWVRVDDNDSGESYAQYNDFDNPKAFFVDFFEGNWMEDESGLLSMVLGMRNNKVRGYKVKHNSLGAYIVHNGRRYYVLVQS